MAHLPPKFPETWPQHLPIPPPTSSFTHHPSWLDEFFEFSSTKRGGAHRRSMSDSIAFFDSGPPPSSSSSSFFDRLDDSQLFSMFSDHPPPSSSAPPSTSPSTPSDNNSINDHDLKPIPLPPSPNDQSEAQSADTSAPPAASAHRPLADPRRVKRILANRQSAQRSRVRKMQYISELERSVNTLQTEVSALSPRVAFFDHQRSILTVGNSHLRHRIAALAQDNIFKDAHQEALKKEIERLTNVYHQQNLKKLDGAPAADIKELPSNT